MKTASRGDFSTDKRVLYLSGIGVVIGAISAVVALVLLRLIAFFTNLFFFGRLSLDSTSPAVNHLGLWVIAIPAVGGLIVGLMARFGSDKIRGHGIPEALEAILFGKSVMNPKVAILKPLSSAVAIGSGGPFGAEGPIIMTGGAFGSLLAQICHVTAAERKTLLVAGAAAGMTAIFATPVAAVLLAVEVLLFEWKPRSLIPVAVASLTAGVIRPFLLGAGPVFPIAVHATMTPIGLVACLAVGLIAGLFSTVTSNLLYRIEDGFKKLPMHWMWWCVIGGIVVGVGGYFEPRALGVGYDVIDQLLKSQIAPGAALSLVFVKALIWVIALASGTSGGVLAPLLMMGCGLGVVEAAYFPHGLSVLYPLISMAAVMGGIMRAPLTAILFALELTHDLDALVPAMAATIISYAVTVLIMKRSILTEKVARRGYDIFNEYTVDPLEIVAVGEVMTTIVDTIGAAAPVSEILARYFGPGSKSRGYPVIDENGSLVGVLTFPDLAGAAAKSVARDLAKKAVTALPHESCRTAAERMATLELGRLPVVSSDNPARVVGIVTRSDVMRPRSEHRALEQERERIYFRRSFRRIARVASARIR